MLSLVLLFLGTLQPLSRIEQCAEKWSRHEALFPRAERNDEGACLHVPAIEARHLLCLGLARSALQPLPLAKKLTSQGCSHSHRRVIRGHNGNSLKRIVYIVASMQLYDHWNRYTISWPELLKGPITSVLQAPDMSVAGVCRWTWRLLLRSPPHLKLLLLAMLSVGLVTAVSSLFLVLISYFGYRLRKRNKARRRWTLSQLRLFEHDETPKYCIAGFFHPYWCAHH